MVSGLSHSCRSRGLLILLLAAVIGWSSLATSASGQRRKRKSRARPAVRDYRSPHFLVHTDLDAKEAKQLLTRLETMLRLISGYWGKPCRSIIECYVVKDLSKWPPGSLHPDGRRKIERRAGVTLSRTATLGKRFVSQAVVYAVAERGTPQHEAVHAYCRLTFGEVGPTWYSEGMAEMGQYWKADNSSVNAHDVVIRYLKKSPPKSLTEIVAPNQATGDSWQNYAWRWALCHLLSQNTNYAARFRPLGLGLLTKQPVSFEQVYGPRAAEISFEYLFFLKHLDRGYRVDLCSWDWSRKFKPLTTTSRTIATPVLARKGWQPTGLTVTQGSKYTYKATGRWKTSKAGSSVDADGGKKSEGVLMGIVLSPDYKLRTPFRLGSKGTLSAMASGNLYVRCADRWNEIADNSGRIVVRLGVAK